MMLVSSYTCFTRFSIYRSSEVLDWVPEGHAYGGEGAIVVHDCRLVRLTFV